MLDRRRADPHVNLASTGIAQHLDDLYGPTVKAAAWEIA